jgi:hypothetical protein
MRGFGLCQLTALNFDFRHLGFLAFTYHERLTNFLKVAFTSYGEQSKRQRKLLHKAFGVSTIPSYQPLLQTEIHSFLRRLIVDPAEYTKHIRRYAGGLTRKRRMEEFMDRSYEFVKNGIGGSLATGEIWPFPSQKNKPTSMHCAANSV